MQKISQMPLYYTVCLIKTDIALNTSSLRYWYFRSCEKATLHLGLEIYKIKEIKISELTN